MNHWGGLCRLTYLTENKRVSQNHQDPTQQQKYKIPEIYTATSSLPIEIPPSTTLTTLPICSRQSDPIKNNTSLQKDHQQKLNYI